MTETSNTDWFEVMAKLQRGDRLALLQVTRVITGYLARYRAYDIRDSWDDLCQDVLMALIKAFEQNRIEHPNAFVSYLGIVTRNKLADWIQRSQRNGSDAFLGDQDTALAILDKVDMDDSHRHREDLLDLQHALDTMPERERQVVTCIYIEGLSYEEAAQRLELALGTLKRLQTAGLKILRQKMRIEMQKNRSDSRAPPDLSDTAPETHTIKSSGQDPP